MKGDVQISKELNRKIDKFIVSLSSNLSEDKETIKDFRDEMKTNFIISFKELIEQGNSEEEAFKIALSKFGDAKDLKKDLTSIFNVRSKSNKISFYVLVISLLIGLACFISHKRLDEYRSVNFPQDLQEETSIKLQEGMAINSDRVNEVVNKNKKKIQFVAVYKEEEDKKVLKEIYPLGFDKDVFNKTLENNHYFVVYCQSPSGEQYELRIGFNIIYIPFNEIAVGIAFLVLYWIAFGIWATTYAYNINRLNLGWTILFFIFNIIGYGIFLLDNKIRLKDSAILN
ncbi:hypothetical protein CSC2_23240 [Clostridium zeae]|uniref:Uncharacterized protein n=1 Tax=Clostridium zeae TaxID=2759022 RepID=A0ABQ1EAP7_9CLOT|nr:permease prefix domain 1-containing protein [Clostridium zeae]GFZ31798.1 hypothetical protein CSC2_23240 [Clostridium zeae]